MPMRRRREEDEDNKESIYTGKKVQALTAELTATAAMLG
jgi:hypothetical protein